MADESTQAYAPAEPPEYELARQAADEVGLAGITRIRFLAGAASWAMDGRYLTWSELLAGAQAVVTRTVGDATQAAAAIGEDTVAEQPPGVETLHKLSYYELS